MKLNKFIAFAIAGVAFATSCEKAIDEIQPAGGSLLASQVKETNAAIPTRVNATFTGMYTKTGEPLSVKFSSSRPDNFGFIMISYSTDIEAADLIVPDSGYNWFSVCGELSSRTANYANPYIRYAVPYNEIAICNDLITSFPADTEDPEIIAKIAQAKAMRAFSYLNLAPYFQFSYATASDKPCVPIVTEETTDFTNNPRATVAEVYDLIISDLNYAIEGLEGYTRPDKAKIDQQVAYGLRARAYLNMGKWAEALADAEKAADGYTPCTIDEIKDRTVWFKDINEHNWIWGYDMTTEIAAIYKVANSSSWLRSFSGYSYTAWCQVYACINKDLYSKISDNDVRKSWWVDENLESPLIAGLQWLTLGDVANADDGDNKLAYIPYTNVKFGCNEIATETNDEDFPYMRVEEMILIQAECQARLGNEAKAAEILNDFIKTYRNPSYSAAATHCSNILDEIWFQRRVELWGEGFSNGDTRRLNKPLVRFHKGRENNQPDAFRFNMTADDGWWLMRFPQSELNTNLAVKDNVDGTSPKMDQNGDLLDGVTD